MTLLLVQSTDKWPIVRQRINDIVNEVNNNPWGGWSLDDLTDVIITTPTSWQALTYNGTDWINSTPAWGGDMLKSTYDTNDNGIVDNSEALGWQVGSHYLARTNHTWTQAISTITNLQAILNEKAEFSAIPYYTSELINDSWFITSAPVTSVNGRTGEVTGLAEANAVVDLSTAQMVWGQKEFTMLADYDLWTTGWTVAINWNNWLNQKITLNANTTFTFANPRQWHVHEILLTQHSTARTVTFPTVTWANGTAPDLSVASGQYLIQLTYRGTTYYWASISFNA